VFLKNILKNKNNADTFTSAGFAMQKKVFNLYHKINSEPTKMNKPISLTIILYVCLMAHLSAQKIPAANAENNNPIPGFSLWEENMKKYGMKHSGEKAFVIINEPRCETFVWYYDGPRVFYQIAGYTGNSAWNTFAENNIMIYRDYVFALNGRVPGWRIFPHGLYMHYKLTGDEKSKEAALMLAQKSAFASAGGGTGESLSRETAYCINAYLVAELLGEPRHAKLEQAVKYALGHIDQWFVQNTSKNWAPFMFGLTCEALINYYEQVKKDPRILTAIKMGLDECWERAWIEEKQSFFYRADNPAGAAPTLNLLVAPAYAWVFLQTGDITYRDKGDKIFAGGVKGTYLDGGKQFSQNYRWSFDYVKWRNEAEQIWNISVK
jgi:hypothetical protein